ncbi:MAG TPA: GeoRSP system SPASM domain protein, partial [Geobacteraceae bacterium]
MEIPSPITIYWDLPAAGQETLSLRRICGDIVACRPLMLQVTDPAALSEGVVAALERLKGSGISVTLTVPAAFLKKEGRGRLHDLGLKELLLDAERVDQVREVAAL